jgi:puromycin-sensitive aminopeptidase
MTTKNKSIRLPNHISPIHYKLTIKPDLEAFVFSGNEIIKININKDTKKITLHSKDLDIETVSIGSKKNTKEKQFAHKITYNTEKETASFYFKNNIKKGKYEISITFCGIINENLRGFYKSKYTLNGEEKYIATTQFEATDARRAFPCFDEPAHKAIFEVSFIIPNSHTAISNTLPINIQEHESGFKIISFAPSPIMSTYLLAFIIGEFEYIENKTKNGVQIRVFTTAGKIHQAKFALDVAIKSLEFYEEYFDIPYPLPTLDLIAIPDFEAGAMENWGAITFRETALLVDEEHSSITNKQWVAITISHELAHQWFGNLVTMHWWTDLWLNEGFASYMEYLCLDKIFPHWNVWELFLSNNRYKKSIQVDSLKNSHPIEVEVHHPDEISEIFDMLSYEKGSTIIRMLSNYIVEDKFRDGLRYYLKKHSYSNTKTLDLWTAFEKISKKPIKKIMQSWTSQAGFPLVRIKLENNKLNLTQERFFLSRISRKDLSTQAGNIKKNLWQIPLSYNIIKNDKKIKETILIDKKNIKLNQKDIGKVNINETSFIKVSYNKETLDLLKKEILEGRMSIIDRLGIIRDIFALAEGGYIKTSTALEFSLAYKNETEYIVWAELSYGINKIYNIIENEQYKNIYKNYALSFFSKLAEDIGFDKKENEKYSYKLLRSLAISQAAFYGNKKIIKEAIKIFSNNIVKPIDPDIRGLIYSIVAQNGGIKEWKYFENLYKNTEMHEEKDRCAMSLTQFKNEKLIQKTLSFIMSKNVRNQNTTFLLSSEWNNKKAQEITLKFIKENWDEMLKRFGGTGFLLAQLLESLGNHTKLEDLKDAKKFWKSNVAPGAERTLEQAYERIASNAAWIKDDKKDIEKWLEKNF